MSAILGRVEFRNRTVDQPRFESAFSTLADYGRDGKAVVYGPNHAFGVQYFRVKPVQSGNLELERDGCILAADGILDARASLLKKLGLAGAQEDAPSDFDLIRSAFLKWGQDSPNHLLGDYAFAAYDPETQELFLARDHIGKRPLYWTRRNDSFTFSTDIAALLAFGDTDREIDRKVLLRHMRQSFRPQPKSLMKGINFVDPGCYMVVDPVGQRQTRWWYPHKVRTVHGRSSETCVRELKQLLEQVMEDYVDTELPLGSHLSGGIDSGTVTALSAKALRRAGWSLVSAYAWAPDFSDDFPDQGKKDERHNIRKICESSDISVRFGSTDFRTLEAFHKRPFEIEGFADLSEEPAVLAQASQDGVRVMLSGWGGDEAFSTIGNGYLSCCLKRFRFVEAFRVLRSISGNRKKPRILMRALYHVGLLPLLPNWLGRRLMQRKEADVPTAFIDPSFLDSDPGLTAWCNRGLSRSTSNPKAYLANLHLYGHLAARADTWAKWSSAYGIQYRYPLLDRRIMEFMLAVPNKFLFADGEPRYLARQATKELLPANLMKYDSANERLRWKLRFDYWKALSDDGRSDEFLGESAWLDMPAVRDAIERYPDKLSQDDMWTFRRLSMSIRVWYLEQRYRSVRKGP